MGILDKILKPKDKKRKYSDDDYIRTSLIYNEEDNRNLIILLSFTENYFADAIDLLSSSTLTTKFVQVGPDEDDENYDPNEEVILYNYLLIGGSHDKYVELIKNVSLSNSLLLEIINEIYEHVDKSKFKSLIKDMVLYDRLFSGNGTTHKPHKLINENDTIYYDSAKYILSKLPKEFTGDMILPFINVYLSYKSYNGSSFIKYGGYSDEIYSTMFNGVVKHPTRENLYKLTKPLYKRESLEGELEAGSISSPELHEIFQQEYDRFNCIAEDTVNYTNIDEVISADDPEYEDIKSNDLKDY